MVGLGLFLLLAQIQGPARAQAGAAPAAAGVSRQNLKPPRARQPQPIANQALTIPPASSLGVQFVQVATAANISGNLTIIDHPLTNGHPDAIVLVTPNYHPGGVGGTYDNHPIGVYYNGGQWTIFNQDLGSMPVDAAFNVMVYYKLYLPLIMR
jgi:hypothetical protein